MSCGEPVLGAQRAACSARFVWAAEAGCGSRYPWGSGPLQSSVLYQACAGRRISLESGPCWWYTAGRWKKTPQKHCTISLSLFSHRSLWFLVSGSQNQCNFQQKHQCQVRLKRSCTQMTWTYGRTSFGLDAVWDLNLVARTCMQNSHYRQSPMYKMFYIQVKIDNSYVKRGR